MTNWLVQHNAFAPEQTSGPDALLATKPGRVGPVFLTSPPSPPRPVLAKTDLLANIAFRARFGQETARA